MRENTKLFEVKDILIMNRNDEEEFLYLMTEYPLFFHQLAERKEGVTILKDTVPIAILSYCYNPNGSIKFFAFASTEFKEKYATKTIRFIKQYSDWLKTQTFRVEVDCVDNETNKRFIEFLGYSLEGVQRRGWIDGIRDRYMYAWTKKL